jgi:hypothetical protein
MEIRGRAISLFAKRRRCFRVGSFEERSLMHEVGERAVALVRSGRHRLKLFEYKFSLEIKSPEVMLNSFVTVGSSLSNPCGPSFVPLRVNAISLGFRANRQPDKLAQRLGTQFPSTGASFRLYSACFRFLRNPLCLSSCDAAERSRLSSRAALTSFNFRAVSKNDCVCTPSIFRVNKNETFVSALIRAMCSESTTD